MSAKEMFKELGYKKIEDAMAIVYHYEDLQVRFWKNSKHIELFGKETPNMNIDDAIQYHLYREEYFENDYKLFVAINKQVEELGWLGDSDVLNNNKN